MSQSKTSGVLVTIIHREVKQPSLKGTKSRLLSKKETVLGFEQPLSLTYFVPLHGPYGKSKLSTNVI